MGAFQTAAFRRVKVGVGRPGGIPNRVEYVLTAFDSASREAVRPAIAAAEARVGEILARYAAQGAQKQNLTESVLPDVRRNRV